MSLAHRQIAYSASVTKSRAYGCQGNCDITADKVMHENSNSWGAVARWPELGEVIGQQPNWYWCCEHCTWVARRGSISLLAQTWLITKIKLIVHLETRIEKKEKKKTHFLITAAFKIPINHMTSLDLWGF